MKRLLLILTLLIPTTVMGEVVEVTCNNPYTTERLYEYRFDLDKKTVIESVTDSRTNEVYTEYEYPLEVFESYLLWFVKFGVHPWDKEDMLAIHVHKLNRKTGKLVIGFVDSNPDKAGAEKSRDCTRRI